MFDHMFVLAAASPLARPAAAAVAALAAAVAALQAAAVGPRTATSPTPTRVPRVARSQVIHA